MRRDQPTTPFDAESDEMTQQFWGASRSWVSREQQTVGRRAERTPSTAPRGNTRGGTRDETTGSLRVIREGFAAFRPQTSANATGEISRQRRHGEPRRPAPPAAAAGRGEATLGELAAGRHAVDGWPDHQPGHHGRDGDPHAVDRRDIEPDHEIPLTPMQPLVERLGLGAVDPLLVRAGALLLALILLVPVVLSLRPERDDTLPGDVVEAPQQVVAGAAPASGAAEPMTAAAGDVAPATGVTTETTATTPSAGPDTAATQPAAPPAATSTDDDPTTSAAMTGAVAVADSAAAVDVVAERVVPACPQTYTAAAGDSWYRIADEAGVAPSDLLAENNATTETVILPGDDICLPEGAAMPTPPTTVVPGTTDASSTTEPASTTTAAPTTTAPTNTTPTTAPATTVAPVPSLSRAAVQELIRTTWPDDEVETALDIARRESNFVATADNGSCCVGVFQIYWSVHRSWLDDFGVTERSDLFDARKNIAAAYDMWQRSGWGPWGG